MTGLQRGRTVVFAVLATVLALLAHVAAGGATPAAGSLLLVALLAGTAGSWLASRRPGALRGALGLALVELVAHTLFEAAAPMPAPMPAPMGVGHGAHPAAMGLAHAVAVVVTGLLLTRGEQAVEALLTRVLPALPGRAVPTTPAARLRLLPVPPPVPALGLVVVDHLTLRGPPGSPAVAL